MRNNSAFLGFVRDLLQSGGVGQQRGRRDDDDRGERPHCVLAVLVKVWPTHPRFEVINRARYEGR